MADNQRQLALAMAERERRKRQAQLQEATAQPEGDDGILSNINRLASQFTAGAFSLLPEVARRPLVERGLIIDPSQQPSTAGESAMRFVGAAAPFIAAAPAAGARAAMAAPGEMLSAVRNPGAIRGLLQDIGRFAQQRPVVYAGSEVAGAAGAGAAGQVAREGGAGPIGQALSEAAGGLTAGGLVSMAPRGFSAAREGLTANLSPFTREGGEIRAARQMQERAGGQERARELAVRLGDIPEGVTPAQWLGDDLLLAQEARIIADNPDIAPRIRADLEEARVVAQENIRDSFGRPRTREEWEFNVLQQVTPEGANIARGQTDEMLDSAYQSFKPLYDSAKGYEVPAAGLQNSLLSAALDPNIIATGQERRAVRSWLDSQYQAFAPSDELQSLPSDEILNLRSRIRDERRSQIRRGNQERADLLGQAESELTLRLEDSLPPEVTETVRAADSQYRKYKVMENAIFNAGDSNLTPEQLSQSIRMGGVTSPSRYARGVDPETQALRQQALAGRNTEEVIGDPRRASLLVRGLDDEGKRAVQADFMNTLFERARSSATEATEAGTALVRGNALLRDIAENRPVMRALGMNEGDIQRLTNMAREVERLSKKAPGATGSLFEDGPASILQLVAALAGSKSGQRMSGGGLGSSLVMAQYMSNRARQTLANLTSNEAERLMTDAATDPQLYRVLLTKNIRNPAEGKEKARYIESWIAASIANQLQQSGDQ